MTESMSTIDETMISPFILPYIVAAQKEKTVGNSTVFQSPTGSAMVSPPRSMYSPVSPKSPKSPQPRSPQRESHRKVAPSTPSPQKRVEAMSPGVLHRSVIEQSVHELHFDPELTFIASPKSSSPSPATRHGGLPTSRMLLDSPVKAVSPNRSVVPLDETEIGFSNELRASMEVTGSLSTLIEEESISTARSKRQRVQSPESNPSLEPGPRVRKIRKPQVTETTPVVPPLEEKNPIPAPVPRSAKRKQVDPEPEVPQTVTRSARKKPEVVEEVKSSGKKVDVVEPVTRSSRKQVVEPLSAAPEPVTRSTRKRVQPPLPETKPSAALSRKSPRFASKVVPSASSTDNAVTSCPKCAKQYKRKDLFEKHVKSCTI